MEKISDCFICHSKKVCIRFDCDHQICSNCIHLPILTNFQEIKTLKEIDEEVLYKCVKCKNGKLSISNISLINFIESDSKDYITPEHELCNRHHKILKAYCKSCSNNLCLLCYDEHNNDHEIINLKYFQNNIGNHCIDHKEKLILYCTTCDMLICNICMDLKHLNHISKFTSDYFSNIKKDLNLVRLPYNSDSINSFLETFADQENLFLKQMQNDHEEIKKNISELVAYLNDINHSFQLKFHKLENDFRFNCQLIKQLFNNYFKDMNKISQLDYQRLEYLNKLPKEFGDFKFDSSLKKQVFFDILSTVKDTISTLKDESKLISYKINDKIYIIGNLKCKLTLEGHTNYVLSIIHLQNGLIASGSRDNSIKIWDPSQNFKCIRTLEGHSYGIHSLIQLQNGLIASGSSDDSIKIWDPTQHFKCIQTLQGHTASVYSIIQLQNGLMASVSGDKSIKMWDPAKNFMFIGTLEGHTDCIHSIIQLQNGLIASASSDKSIKIWDPRQNFKCTQTFEAHTDCVHSIIQLQGGLMASASSDDSIKIWDPNQHFKCIQILQGHTASVYRIIQLQTGLIASASSDKSIKIWDPTQQFKCIQTLQGHSNYVLSIIQLQNGYLASGSMDNSIKIWR